MTSREHVIRIVYDELVKIIGTGKEIPLKKQTIMMVGLYGQGKTTTCGKVAKYFQKKGLKPAIIAADVHRPAAYDQLMQIGESINVPVYGDRASKNAVKIVKNGMDELKGNDIIIIDTAGRDQLQDDLIKEMKAIAAAAMPDERFLVIDATIGQQAGPQAKAFHDAIDITGVIITKLDGTAKGGGAISAVAETKAPIVFVGVGEKINDLEKFDSARFVSKLLGMGDLQSLLEKANEVMDKDKAEKTARKLMSGKFTLNEMYEQMDAINKMGPLKQVMSMIPGLGGLGGGLGGKMKIDDQNLEETQEKLAKFRILMSSMTEEEKENPKVIDSSRIKRVARGAGVETQDVRDLLKYYETSKKAMRMLTSNKKMQKNLMKQLKFEN
jgi:signal recognition particle subunit SRP54